MKYNPTTSSYVLHMYERCGREEGECIILIYTRRSDGLSFTVKVAETANYPQEYKKGDVVTFSYDSFSRNSIPVNPKILRARRDLSWKEVLLQESKPTQLGGIPPPLSHPVLHFRLMIIF